MQVVAVQEELQTTLQIVREQVAAQQRDPLRKFKERVRELNYGPCAQLQPLNLRDVARVDVHAACHYFSQCFRDPSEFTLCFVGARPTLSTLCVFRAQLMALSLRVWVGRTGCLGWKQNSISTCYATSCMQATWKKKCSWIWPSVT